MASNLILVDSNVLIYAINSTSPKNHLAQQFLQSNVGDLAIAHQNVLESLRVLTHGKFSNPMSVAEASKALDNIVKACRIISPNRLTYQLALGLLNKYSLSGDKIFDAYLAATAIANDITTIATDNVKDFEYIKELSTVNPFVEVK
jgi:predicted nucleic acid-binding protein